MLQGSIKIEPGPVEQKILQSMGRIKGLRKLRAELRRFHEELSGINSLPADAQRDGSHSEDDASWDSGNGASSRFSLENEVDWHGASLDHQSRRKADEKSAPLENDGNASKTEDGEVESAGQQRSGEEEEASQGPEAEEEIFGLNEGCGELSCKAASWNGHGQCECHVEQVVRLSAISLFTANIGRVLSSDQGSTDQLFASNSYRQSGLSTVDSGRRDFDGEIAIRQKTTGISDGSQVISKSCVQAMETTFPHAATGTGSTIARSSVTLSLGTIGLRKGRPQETATTGVPQIEEADARRDKRPDKETQTFESSGRERPDDDRSKFAAHWKHKGQKRGLKEDLMATKMALKIKQALQGPNAGSRKYEFATQGSKLAKMLGYNAWSSPTSGGAARDRGKHTGDLVAESYLANVLAALSPGELSGGGRTRLSPDTNRMSRNSSAEPKTAADDQDWRPGYVDDRAGGQQGCICSQGPSGEKQPLFPGPSTAQGMTPDVGSTGHFKTFLEIPKGAPISISYGPNSSHVGHEKQDAAVQVCSPRHVESSNQLCPLEQCPAACNNSEQPSEAPDNNQVAVQAKDQIEKKFEAATGLLYNLDPRNGRNNGEREFPRDRHWNCGKPQMLERKPAHCNQKTKVQPSKCFSRKKGTMKENSLVKADPHINAKQRIAAAAGLADEIEALMATFDSKDQIPEHPPCRYTRLDAPVLAAAQAVSKITEDPPPLDVVQSKWRQLFATQIGRETCAQEVVKKLIGGTMDYDKVRQDLNDIRKERDKIMQFERLHRLKKPPSLDKDVAKHWQEPCLLPGYQGERQDELFLNSLRQELDSRIASAHTNPRGKRQKIVHPPPTHERKKLIQASSKEILPGLTAAFGLQGSHSGAANDVMKRQAMAPTTAKLENLVKEVRTMIRKTSLPPASHLKARGVQSQRSDTLPPWLEKSTSQIWPDYIKLGGFESAEAPGKHFVKAALRRREVRPPATLFKTGVSINWMADGVSSVKQEAGALRKNVEGVTARISRHPRKSAKQAKNTTSIMKNSNVADVGQDRKRLSSPRSKKHQGKASANIIKEEQPDICFEEFYNMKEDWLVKFHPTVKQGSPPKSKKNRKVVSKLEIAKDIRRQREEESIWKVKDRQIVGPVIDFSNPFERDRNLWPVPKSKESKRKADNRKAKRQEIVPVIDFSNKYEGERNLWPVVRKEEDAEIQRNELEREWRRLEKDRTLVEIYGSRLPRRKLQTLAYVRSKDKHRSHLSPRSSPHRRSQHIPESRQSQRGVTGSQLKRKAYHSPSSSKSPIAGRINAVDNWDLDDDSESKTNIEYSDRQREGHGVPKGRRFDGHISNASKPSRTFKPVNSRANKSEFDDPSEMKTKKVHPMADLKVQMGRSVHGTSRSGHIHRHLPKSGNSTAQNSNVDDCSEMRRKVLSITDLEGRLGGTAHDIPKGGHFDHLGSHLSKSSKPESTTAENSVFGNSSEIETEIQSMADLEDTLVGPAHNVATGWHSDHPGSHLSKSQSKAGHSKSGNPSKVRTNIRRPITPLESRMGATSSHMDMDVDHQRMTATYTARPRDSVDDRSASSGSSRLSSEAGKGGLDRLIDTLATEALQKDASKFLTGKPNTQAGGERAKLDREAPSEGHYESDEFCSDTEDPTMETKVQEMQSKMVPKELMAEKKELEAEVLTQALKEIVLQSVLKDQERRIENMQLHSEDETHFQKKIQPLMSEKEFETDSSWALARGASSGERYREEGAGAETKKKNVSIVGVQTEAFQQRYAGVQTIEYDQKYAGSQTTDSEKKYAGMQTMPLDRKYAGVQTREYRYSESQTKDFQQRPAGVQTMDLEGRYVGVQTLPTEQRYASVQTRSDSQRYTTSEYPGVQTMGDERRYAGVQTIPTEQRYATVQTTSEPQRYAAVQTSDYAREETRGYAKSYGETQTTVLEQRVAGVQTPDYEQKYGEVQTIPTEQSHARVQTRDDPQRYPGSAKAESSSVQVVETQRGLHGQESMRYLPGSGTTHILSDEFHRTEVTTGYFHPVHGYMEGGMRWRAISETPVMKQISALEVIPSAFKAGYYVPEYGRVEVHEGTRWQEEGEAAPMKRISALHATPSGTKATYFVPPDYDQMSVHEGSERQHEAGAAQMKQISALEAGSTASRSGYHVPEYGRVQVHEGARRQHEGESPFMKQISALEAGPSASKAGYHVPEYGRVQVKKGARRQHEGEAPFMKQISALEVSPSASKVRYYVPEYGQMEVHEATRQQHEGEPLLIKQSSALEVSPSASRAGYYVPEYGRKEVHEGTRWHQASEAAPVKQISSLQTTASGAKAGYHVPEHGRMQIHEGTGLQHLAEQQDETDFRGNQLVKNSAHVSNARVRQEQNLGRADSPSSPATPSTPSSDPVHEAMVAAALAPFPSVSDARSIPGRTGARWDEAVRSSSFSQTEEPAVTSTMVTQTDEHKLKDNAGQTMEEPINTLSSRRRLRRVEQMEAIALSMISKAIKTDSSHPSSADISVASLERVEPVAVDNSNLSPGELDDFPVMVGQIIARYSELDEDISTRYFKLKRYSAKQLDTMLQDRDDSSQLSEGETDVGQLHLIEEPGQSQLSGDHHTDNNHHGEPGELRWNDDNPTPRERFGIIHRDSRSEGEVSSGSMDPGEV